jgi:hypothetical protein
MDRNKPSCLYITSIFMLIPIIIFSFKTPKTFHETILAFLLLINSILSFLFWKNPTKNSSIHLYDGRFAKISYILFPLYVLFIKNTCYNIKLLFVITFSLSSIIFYYSNTYSKKCWCSNKHILCHSLFHFLVIVGTSLTFI